MQGGSYYHGGYHLTLSLKEKIWNLLSPKPKFIDHADLPLIEALKEKHCYTAMDYKQTLRSLENFSFPIKTDYHGIKLSKECFDIPEKFFTPADFGSSIQKFLKKLLEIFDFPIILVGGSSLFPGFPERLHLELLKFKTIGPPMGDYRKIKIIAPPERQFMSVLGAKKLVLDPEHKWNGKTTLEEFK